MKKAFSDKTFRGSLFGHRNTEYNTVELKNQTDESFPYLRKIKRERHTIHR